MVSCFGLIGDYSNKFHCAVGLDQYTYYDLIYQKNPTIEEIMDTKYSLDIIAYDLFNMGRNRKTNGEVVKRR